MAGRKFKTGPFDDKTWLQMQYHYLNKNMRSIAKECKVSDGLIAKWIHYFQIEINPPRKKVNKKCNKCIIDFSNNIGVEING